MSLGWCEIIVCLVVDVSMSSYILIGSELVVVFGVDATNGLLFGGGWDLVRSLSSMVVWSSALFFRSSGDSLIFVCWRLCFWSCFLVMVPFLGL